MGILYHNELKKDLKKLGKKFPAPQESLGSWLLLFETKGLAEIHGVDKYPRVFSSHDIYKARVVPVKEKCGKSGGYRLIFELRGRDLIILCFSRHGVYKSEQELISIVKYRLSNFDDDSCS